jgi:Flp pilus assembly protein TadG
MPAGSSHPRVSRLRRWPPLARLLARAESGMAAVEFSLILPVLILLWIGGVEVTQALSIDRRLNNLSSSIGDLVARSKLVTYADVTKIFDIGPGALFPYCGGPPPQPSCTSAGLQMRITAVDMNGTGTPSVAWSRASGTTAYTSSNNALLLTLVPSALRVANTQVIMAEVFYPYTPAVGKVIVGTRTLNDRMYFVPRLVNNIQLCDDNKQNCVS